MATAETCRPVEIRAPRSARTVEIDWSDGETTRYDLAVLRGYCPCANCQGHQGTVRFVDGDSRELVTIEEVGDYALRFVFPDCGTGIYTFPYLLRLGALWGGTFSPGQPLPSPAVGG